MSSSQCGKDAEGGKILNSASRLFSIKMSTHTALTICKMQNRLKFKFYMNMYAEPLRNYITVNLRFVRALVNDRQSHLHANRLHLLDFSV